MIQALQLRSNSLICAPFDALSFHFSIPCHSHSHCHEDHRHHHFHCHLHFHLLFLLRRSVLMFCDHGPRPRSCACSERETKEKTTMMVWSSFSSLQRLDGSCRWRPERLEGQSVSSLSFSLTSLSHSCLLLLLLLLLLHRLIRRRGPGMSSLQPGTVFPLLQPLHPHPRRPLRAGIPHQKSPSCPWDR